MLNNSVSKVIPQFKYTLTEDEEYLPIINLADIHYGNIACNRDFLKAVINHIEDNQIYWVSTGDMLEVNTSKGKHFDHDGMNVNDEWEEFTELIKPITHLCLGFVGSNHSARIGRLSDFEIDRTVAKLLNVPFYGGLGLINITVNNKAYYVTMTHGKSNGMTLGAKANSLQRLYDVMPNVDLCLEGHTHTYMVTQKEVNQIDKRHNKIQQSTVTMCVAGHCLEWGRSYAASNKYPPSPMGFPEIKLYKNKKNIDIRLITPNSL